MLNEDNEKGKMTRVDKTVKVDLQQISGWGTEEAAFVTAVGVLTESGYGSGYVLSTLGLPVGLVVMIMLAVLVPSVVTGGTASNKSCERSKLVILGTSS